MPNPLERRSLLEVGATFVSDQRSWNRFAERLRRAELVAIVDALYRFLRCDAIPKRRAARSRRARKRTRACRHEQESEDMPPADPTRPLETSSFPHSWTPKRLHRVPSAFRTQDPFFVPSWRPAPLRRTISAPLVPSSLGYRASGSPQWGMTLSPTRSHMHVAPGNVPALRTISTLGRTRARAQTRVDKAYP